MSTRNKTMKIINYIGIALGLASIVLGWVWFGWELPLVIYLAIIGNNMEQNNKVKR